MTGTALPALRGAVRSPVAAQFPLVEDVLQVLAPLGTVERAILTAVTVAVAYGVWRLCRSVASNARGAQTDQVLDGLLAVLALALVAGVAGALVLVWNTNPMTAAAVAAVERRAHVGVQVALTVGLVLGAYIVTGVLHRTVNEFVANRENITDHEAEVSYRVLQITLYVLGLLAVLSVWSVDLSGLLIGAGFAGIVLGMAARQTLGAVIAGFVLMFARPFEIGDWVKIGEKDGIVTDITIVNTRIQTFDGEYVILPNDYVGSEEVVNRSRKGRLRLHVEVGVDYASDVDRAIDVAEDALGDVEEILTVPQPHVVLTEFGASSVVLDLRFWIDKPSARRKWRAQTAVISAVHGAFKEEDITIPFPQRELSTRGSEGVGVNVPDEYGTGADPDG